MKRVIFAALFAISSPVFAQGYVGLGIGQSSVDSDSSPVPVPGYSGMLYPTNIEDSDTSFKVFAGFDLHKNFALEAGYVDFGTFGTTLAGTFTDGTFIYDSTAEGSSDAFAIYAAVVGKLPVSNAVDLFVKAGFARWDVESTAAAVVDVYDAGTSAYLGTGYGYDSESASGVDPMFGVGINIHASDAFMIRAEFERFIDVGDENTTGQSDVDVIGVSAAVKF